MTQELCDITIYDIQYRYWMSDMISDIWVPTVGAKINFPFAFCTTVVAR